MAVDVRTSLTFPSHLSGYRNSAPVRIGNGAAFHQQFDIYGELMDAIYLYNKYGKPITWDQWVSVREILDYVLTIWRGKLTPLPSLNRCLMLGAVADIINRARYVHLGSSQQQAEFYLLEDYAVGCV